MTRSRLIGLVQPMNDCGSNRPAAAPAPHPQPVEGGERIARGLVGLAETAPGATLLERTVNGQPGLVGQQDGVTVVVLAFDVVGDHVTRVWAVRNPEKLRLWNPR